MVPNVPRGVERPLLPQVDEEGERTFLMYRVELKALQTYLIYCFSVFKFLMYRVELKERPCHQGRFPSELFLMYRVELKVNTLQNPFGKSSEFLMYRVELKGK